MAIAYEYYQKLKEESEILIKKYDDMKLWKKYEELKPYDKLYEPVSDSVKFPPYTGRYDRFFSLLLGKENTIHPENFSLNYLQQNIMYMNMITKMD